MKITKTILLGIIVSHSALCQNIAHTKSIKVAMKADTTKVLEGSRGPLEVDKLVNLLTGEGYHFLTPYNIGIRIINNGDTSASFYQGFQWEMSRPFNAFIIPNHAQIEICAVAVDEKNAADFRCHIVQNDKADLVPWTKPSVFKSLSYGNIKYCYLGKFNYSSKQLLKVEMYNVNDDYNRYTVLIDWREVRRPFFGGGIQYVSANHPPSSGWGLMGRGLYDTAKTREPHYQQKNGKSIITWVPYKDFIETSLPKQKMQLPTDIKFRLGDSLRNMGFTSIVDLRSSGPYEKTYDYKVSLARELQGHNDTITLGNATTGFELSKEFWKYPGKYVLTIVPNIRSSDGSPVTLPKELIQIISFTVLPALNVEHKVPLSLVVVIIVILLAIIGSAFLIYHRLQKRKLITEAQNKQIATLQLQSVRSQLNPHFIFNALASVQNLINKNEIADANKYLVRFARLTRNVLDDEKKDLTSVEHEVNFLDDYLQMEKLRFGFQYTINVDPGVDQQMEIPAMLIQPFVENAVKHGVSSKKNEGLILIAIVKKDEKFIISVKDNGYGFGELQSPGIGIKLCEDRINLLNSIYKNSTISLHKNPDKNGTEIRIELINWQ